VEGAGDGWADVATAFGTVRVEGAAEVGRAVTLALRPEQIGLGGEGWPLGGAVVTEAAFLGSHWRAAARADADGSTLRLHLPPGTGVRAGERLEPAVPSRTAALLAD
jgi:hypothetical protein